MPVETTPPSLTRSPWHRSAPPRSVTLVSSRWWWGPASSSTTPPAHRGPSPAARASPATTAASRRVIPPAPQGVQVAFLQETGSFTQTVAGWAAGSYVLTFYAAQRGNFRASQQNFNVLIDGNVVGTFTPSGTSYQSYSTAVFTVTAGSHDHFQGLDSAGGDNTAFIDAVSVL